MNRHYNRLRRFCAFLIGAVFLVSGVLKLMDPVGAGFVVKEYYAFLHLGFLDFSAKTVGVLAALAEALTGAALATGVWRRAVAYVTSAFLAFFTLLTAALVIFNPVMDCGCFGEAVHLTHIQTFIKNIVLCALAAVAFIPFGRLGRPKKHKYVSMALVSSAILAFSVYSLLYIPLVDFTEYRPAARLASAVDTNLATDTYKASFIYEKDGMQRTFSLDDLPDSTWTYIGTKTESGAEADSNPSLSFTDASGEYADSLAAEGKVFAVSVYDYEGMSEKKWSRTARALMEAEGAGFSPLLVVSADRLVAEQYFRTYVPEFAPVLCEYLYCSDYKTLATLNRSNGGATYFYNGYIVRKWASRNLPAAGELMEDNVADAAETIVNASTAGNIVFQALFLYMFSVLLFI